MKEETDKILFRVFKNCCWYCRFSPKTRKLRGRRKVFCVRWWRWRDDEDRCHMYKYNKTQESPEKYDIFISQCLGEMG